MDYSNKSRIPYPLIQAAGIKSLAEAKILIDCGFNSLGFPLALDYHTPDIDYDEARSIINGLDNSVFSVFITYQKDTKEIIKDAKFLNCKMIQLHGPIGFEAVMELRSCYPEILIMKSLIIGNDDNDPFDMLRTYSNYIDAFILDTYDEISGAIGATGKTHNWEISRRLCNSTNKPVILAGGLNSENVANAINYVKPFGVDSHTGLENEAGDKDVKLSQNFVNNALKAFDKVSE